MIISQKQMDVKRKKNICTRKTQGKRIIPIDTVVFLLQYHIVLVTKYRRPVLTGAVKELVYQVIQDIFDEKDLVILEMNGEADHIHILFEADPFTAPGTLVNVIKTKTSRYARKQYGDTILKESCQDSLFWSNSYFTTIANENSLQLIQEYINNQ